MQDTKLRHSVGAAAFLDALWKYGPERREELASGLIDQILSGSATAAREFELELHRAATVCVPRIRIGRVRNRVRIRLARGMRGGSGYFTLQLCGLRDRRSSESVKAQTISQRELIVIDDFSNDSSLNVAGAWLRENVDNFTHAALLKHRMNSGLARAATRDSLFSDARFIMPLDADNMIEPSCLERCLEVINATGAAAAYPKIRRLGDERGLLNSDHWKPVKFVGGNYIDAMALVRRAAWSAIGGYRRMRAMGWEDFEMWCGFIQHGFWAARGVGAACPLQGPWRIHDSNSKK